MSKRTSHQRLIRAGLPYAVIRTIPEFIKDDEGNVTGIEFDESGSVMRTHQVTGYTLEDRHIEATEENPDGEWVKVWEPHILGEKADFEEAREMAEAWRADLVGTYPLAA